MEVNDISNLRPGRQRAGAGRPAAAVQPGQHALAQRQQLQGDAGEVSRCSRPGSSPAPAATPNSPTCAPPGTRWTPAMQAQVRDLVCEHSQIFSPRRAGLHRIHRGGAAKWRRCRSAWCAGIPRTGRLSLYLSAHAGAIQGWPVPEARALLRDLTEHATQREFVHAHVWRPHDLVMWDNRVTMHRARRYDATRCATCTARRWRTWRRRWSRRRRAEVPGSGPGTTAAGTAAVLTRRHGRP